MTAGGLTAGGGGSLRGLAGTAGCDEDDGFPAGGAGSCAIAMPAAASRPIDQRTMIEGPR
jgi:hypothetical protein